MTKIGSSKFKTVILLQLLGWGLYFIITVFFHSFFVHPFHDEILYAKQTFFFTTLGMLFSFLLYFTYEYIRSVTGSIFLQILTVLISSYITTLIWMTFYRLIISIILESYKIVPNWDNIFHNSFDRNFVLMIWSGIYYIISYWDKLNVEREKALKSDAALNEAKYNILRYQVNPHFLFNALNSIVGMIDEDKSKAKKMVEGLSEFFRFSLNKGDKSFITLNEEIEGIENYLEIEKERFEENLIVEYNISHDAGKQTIPGFIVHPLVENALKFGMMTSKMPLKIEISAQFENNLLTIKIANTGSLQIISAVNSDTIQSTSIGIKNISDRINLAYAEKGKFELKDDNGIVEAIITISNS